MIRPWAVMCCGCRSLLGADGKLIAIDSGLLSLADALSHKTREEADAAAAGFGWAVADSQGPNHRCPSCVAKNAELPPELPPVRVTTRGAYVDLRLISEGVC